MNDVYRRIPVVGLFTSATLATWGFSAEGGAQEAGVDTMASEATSAEAKPLGARGQWHLGAEDLLRATSGSSEITYSSEQGKGTHSDEFSQVKMFWPSAAIDWFPMKGLSLGASARYEFHDAEHAESGDDAARHTAEQRAHLLSLVPRVGYALDVASGFGVWARAGLGNNLNIARATNRSGPTTESRSRTLYELNLDGSVLATYSPGRFVTFFAGPGVVTSLWESSSEETQEVVEDRAIALYLTMGAGIRL